MTTSQLLLLHWGWSRQRGGDGGNEIPCLIHSSIWYVQVILQSNP